MSSQDTVNPLTPLTPPRVLNTYKDRRRKKQQQRKPATASSARRHTGSNRIDEYV